jgi:hypothetical protein
MTFCLEFFSARSAMELPQHVRSQIPGEGGYWGNEEEQYFQDFGSGWIQPFQGCTFSHLPMVGAGAPTMGCMIPTPLGLVEGCDGHGGQLDGGPPIGTSAATTDGGRRPLQQLHRRPACGGYRVHRCPEVDGYRLHRRPEIDGYL